MEEETQTNTGLWTSIIGGVSTLSGDIFGYFGSKDDVALTELQLQQVEAMSDAEVEKQRQRTKMIIIAGIVIGFAVIVFAIIKISKKGK